MLNEATKNAIVVEVPPELATRAEGDQDDCNIGYFGKTAKAKGQENEVTEGVEDTGNGGIEGKCYWCEEFVRMQHIRLDRGEHLYSTYCPVRLLFTVLGHHFRFGHDFRHTLLRGALPEKQFFCKLRYVH